MLEPPLLVILDRLMALATAPLGSMNFGAVMTPSPLFTFTVFVMFYVLCVATLIMLRRELGTKGRLWITLVTVIVPLVAALAARGAALLIFLA